MIKLKTDRLTLIALTAEESALLLNKKSDMEKALGLTPSGTELDAETHEAMSGLHQNAAVRPQDYPWYACWQIILNEKNISVGAACFMGPPDENGEVILGYGTDPVYRNNGYMTEAAARLTQWALSRQGVTAVGAQTDRTNPASHRVLEKCRFARVGETAESFFWKISKN